MRELIRILRPAHSFSMGSFPSSTSVEADAEMFRQLKSKYEEALQGGASEDALFEVMKKVRNNAF